MRFMKSKTSKFFKANSFKTLLGLSIAATVMTAAQAETLKVVISGIGEIKGSVSLAVFDKAEFFPSDHVHAIARLSAKARGETMNFTFENIPEGKYAISVFHDLNGNGELDKNFLGAPKEPYAFSNNVKGAFGPPAFEATLISLSGPETTTAISLE